MCLENSFVRLTFICYSKTTEACINPLLKMALHFRRGIRGYLIQNVHSLFKNNWFILKMFIYEYSNYQQFWDI